MTGFTGTKEKKYTRSEIPSWSWTSDRHATRYGAAAWPSTPSGWWRGGSLKNYADAARQLGVTRARTTQVLNLLNLSAQVQQALLLGDLHLSERRIRALVARAEW